MKIFLLVFLCLFCAFGAFGQTTENNKSEKTGIEEITIMRGDGKGNAGEEAEIFSPHDIPIHSRILLDSVKSVVVKMNLVAIDKKNSKAEKKIVSVSYKTNGRQDEVNFTSSPEKLWLPGKYRFDFLIDGKLAAGREIEISKDSANIIKTKPAKLKPE